MVMIKARYAEEIEGTSDVRCLLCPQACIVNEGRSGRCRVRLNKEGTLYSLIGDRCASVNLDPIEKKPLYHFHPGSRILSFGTFGCNFSCEFCQNWTLSHPDKKYLTCEGIERATDLVTPESALEIALRTKDKGNIGISFTYNEPSIWFEFVLETSRLLRSHGLKSVLVSNGSLNEGPLDELLPYIDAANIDIKSINPSFYRKYCKAELEPVLAYCRKAKDHMLLEITNLLITSLNDSREDLEGLVNWVHDHLGEETPIHFSRYHPDFKMDLPGTPMESIEMAHEIAGRKLKYVYAGNIPFNPWNDTLCPSCRKTVIKREGMGVSSCSLSDGGACGFCGARVNVTGPCRRSW
ncbi:MAG: AmmeMemoRadiSam system radical SAM enzyme [Candidatus Eremiobacteraeota bacterium]|nr:AmmeMemoRadiSam system radical SAM enzyme [Candidatus Eremiobacteraeota bacterium]